MKPGMKPAAKMAPMETPVITPYMMKAMLGGMTEERPEETETTAVAKGLLYPASTIPGMRMTPSAASRLRRPRRRRR